MSFEIAVFVFIAVYVLSRFIARSALGLLDDEAKLKLVNANGAHGWSYVLILLVVGLIFWRADVGGPALVVVVAAMMVFNLHWQFKNDMPAPYIARVTFANAMALVALGFLVFGHGRLYA